MSGEGAEPPQGLKNWRRTAAGHLEPVPTDSPIDVEQVSSNIGQDGADYIIYKEDGTVKARNNKGVVEFSDTDAATVINNAIEALPKTADGYRSGHVHIKAGTYTITTPIGIYGGLNLSGSSIGRDGGGTELTAGDGFNDDILTRGFTTTGGVTGYFSHIEHLRLDGNKAGNTSGSCIYFDISANGDRLRDLSLYRVFCTRAAEYGMWTYHFHGYRLTDCLFEFNDSDGLRVDYGDEGNVIACFFSGNGGHGAYLDTHTSIIIGRAYNNGGDGFHIVRANSLGSKNNVIVQADGNTSNGLYLDGGFNIVRLIANDNGAYGIEFRYGGNVVEIAQPTTANTSGLQNRGFVEESFNIINGMGYNGSNDPSTAGDWNGRGKPGVRVLWDDGTNYYLSTYMGGTWYDVQVDSPVV